MGEQRVGFLRARWVKVGGRFEVRTVVWKGVGLDEAQRAGRAFGPKAVGTEVIEEPSATRRRGLRRVEVLKAIEGTIAVSQRAGVSQWGFGEGR
jgi:hypothetical protein